MWNEDVVKLMIGVSCLELELDFIRSVIEFCVQYTRERIVPLSDDQEKRFKDGLKKVNYVLDGPLCPSKRRFDGLGDMRNRNSFNSI